MRIHPIYQARAGLDSVAIELLEVGRHIVLGTENRNGSVHLTPVSYLFEEDRVYIETSAASRKARNIKARPRATILLQDHRVDGTAWVSGSGRAQFLQGEPAQELNRRIRARFLTDQGEEMVGKVMSIYDDATITVIPEKWMAWDMSALYTTFAEHGLPLDETGDWFRQVSS
ncbi:MAG: pyridoxamine 5'-phosphate oxidase family protein [bacterium]